MSKDEKLSALITKIENMLMLDNAEGLSDKEKGQILKELVDYCLFGHRGK